MSTLYYQNLALGWKPEGNSDREFKIIATAVVVTMLVVGVVLSSLDVPKANRDAKPVIPPRIAKFVLEKEKKKPKPKPVKPKPKPKPIEKHVVKKSLKKHTEIKKPLTKKQVKAREKAEKSGLLALSNELSDLMDTSAVAQEVGGSVNTSAGSAKAARQNSSVLTDNVNKGSGGVNASKYASKVGKSSLAQRDITQVKQTLVASSSQGSGGSSKSTSRTGNVRSEEEVTIAFDQNKSKLYSIYNRERRRNPGLKGKIVLEITIAASGKVTAVKIVSSELNSPSLEQRLINRIKLFNFGAQNVKSVTVTYPIEFLPS